MAYAPLNAGLLGQVKDGYRNSFGSRNLDAAEAAAMQNQTQNWFDGGDGYQYQALGHSRNPELDLIMGMRPGIDKPGDQAPVYKPDGTFSHMMTLGDANKGFKTAMMLAALATGGMMALPGGLLSGATAAGAGAGAGAGAMGPVTAAEAAAQAGLLQAELAPYLATSAAGGAAGGAAGAAMGPPTAAQSAASTAALQAELAPYATGITGAGAGGAAGATAASGGGGAGSGLFGSGITAGQALGAGATLLGAVAGGRGQDASQTTSRDIPEWLKPYVLGANGQPGLLGHTQNVLTQQMSPEFMQGANQMRTAGLGLLNTPQRGNGFGLLTGRNF